MVVTDPSIDPITGLPALNPSGPVQQIPLGQEVFPYADLNATAQPTRGPIYGDDIIPTSSLITAPDDQLKPRSIQSTRTRELRVREAVFQNLGAAIPDGTTAPIDVNVVSGGGGGGGTPFTTARGVDSHVGFGLQPFDTIKPAPATIYRFSGSAYADTLVTGGGGFRDTFSVGFSDYNNLGLYILASGQFFTVPTNNPATNAYLTWDISFPGGWPVVGTYSNANPFTVWTWAPSTDLYVSYTLQYV